mgnify:CR=1 FL=1
MNKQDKLEFINSIPRKLAYTGHIGCDSDWFLYLYDEYKDYQSKFGNPKYIKIKYNETQREAIYILYDEDEKNNIIRYEFYGRGTVSCNSLNIKNELLYLNGQLNDSLGKLTYIESSEDELIDFMYRIANSYYINDIKPMEDKRKIEEEAIETRSSFAQNDFKLEK